MQFLQTTRETLLAPLQSVSNIVDKRHTMPILANVLLEKEGDALTVIASDVDIQITTRSIVAGGEGDGAITVNARKFQDILRALPEGVQISLQLEDNRMLLRAGRSRYTLQTLPAVDFPRMDINEGAPQRITLSQRLLKQKIAQVQYAMAAQDIRYYLNGLLLIVSGSELRLVATDGHRMSYTQLTLDGGDHPKTEAILPRKTVLELVRQLSDSEDPVELEFNGNQVFFRFGQTELVSKLIDGRFPDYERVIPRNYPTHLTLPRAPLTQALQRAAIFTSDKFKGVRLVFDAQTLRIISSNTEREEAEEELEIAYTGDKIDIGFNVTYLLDVLTHLQHDDIDILLRDGHSSALVQIPGSEDFKYVVMPMRI